MSQTKQKNQFENSWKRIISLTQSSNPESAPKIKESEVLTMFQELAVERELQARVVFKTKLAGLLEAKIALDASLKKGREELAKREEKEYEELNNQLNKAFSMLENTKQQNATLVSQASGNFPLPEQDQNDKEEDEVV
jgi:succinate dehydrogenase flavin-adding protein (antitoxin of CptAB toxin-antitoxin module)